MSLVGQPLARREDPKMVRGEACYVDDVRRPGMAYASFVRSYHAHAGITDVRVPAQAPGLLAVITGRDLAGRVRPFPITAPPGVDTADEPHPILALDEVRYVGQPVAAVIAGSPAQAKDAAELVEVDYEPREPVLDPRDSDVELTSWSKSEGDVGGAFAAATHVVRGTYGLPRLVAAPIEPRGGVAEHDPETDRLTVWCSMQDTHRPLAQLSHILGREPERLHVIVPDVGGAFGSKGVIPAELVVASMAAIELARPVKWIEERSENFLGAYQGRGIVGEVELAFDGAGRMLALRANLIADAGAYVWTSTPVPGHTAGVLMVGPYDIPAAAVTVRSKRTNKVPTGPYRGAGRPDAAYFLESLVDDAARQLGIDGVELRRRNLIRRFPHETPLGLSYDSGNFERCLDTALGMLGSGPALRASPESTLQGTGIALYVERAAGRFESATAELGGDGELVVASSASPHGQGHDVTFAQIAADHLGIDVEQVVLRFGDSDRVPPGTGTFGSRSIPVAGSAIVMALDQLLEQGRRLVAHLLGFSVGAVDYRDGRFSAGGRDMDWTEVARFAHQSDRLPDGVELGLRTTARFDSDLVFGSGAYAAQVEIDPETGRLRVLRIVAVDDAGTIINPLLAHGQVIGGAIQGLGECVIEEAIYDADGQLRTGTFVDYGLVSAAEAPPIEIGEVSSPSPRNPLGAKGIGEGGTIGTLPAVANAVADALGGIRLDPPFTAEKLWGALQTA